MKTEEAGRTTTTVSGTQAPKVVDRRDVIPIIAAVIAAIGIATLCWNTLGWHSVAGVGLVTLIGFVATLAAAEYIREDPVPDVDLVAAEAAPDDAPRLALVPEPSSPWTAENDVPRRRRAIRGSDVQEFAFAALGGFAIAELIRIVIKMQSLVGFAIWWYVAFLAVYFALVRNRTDTEG